MSLVLQLDGGNTRLKWRLKDGQMRVCESGAVFYEKLADSDLLSESFIKPISKVYFSTVKVGDELERALQKIRVLIGSENVHEVDHRLLNASDFAYKEFERLGIDRCLAILGGRALAENFCTSYMVIDSGSALTADLVDGGSRHIGGYIFPGLNMLKKSLLGGTSKIELRHDLSYSVSPGVTTEECVEHAVNGMVLSVMRFLVEQALSFSLEKVFVTGGDAPFLLEVLDSGCGLSLEYKEDLVFCGMDYVIAGLENE